jgi:hypothetical protein
MGVMACYRPEFSASVDGGLFQGLYPLLNSEIGDSFLAVSRMIAPVSSSLS